MQLHRIATFAQVNAMAGVQGQAAANGACHNFTIEWLSYMFGDAGNPAQATQRMTRLAARRGAGNPVLQSVFSRRWAEGGNSYKLADRQMIQLRAMRETDLLMDYSAYSQPPIVRAIRQPEHAGFLFSFWFRDLAGANQAHTIGFFRTMRVHRGNLIPSSNTISCFDPNYGEYDIPELQLNYWLNKYKPFYAQNFTHQMMKCVALA